MKDHVCRIYSLPLTQTLPQNQELPRYPSTSPNDIQVATNTNPHKNMYNLTRHTCTSDLAILAGNVPISYSSPDACRSNALYPSLMSCSFACSTFPKFVILSIRIKIRFEKTYRTFSPTKIQMM